MQDQTKQAETAKPRNSRSRSAKTEATRLNIIEAAQHVLRQRGYKRLYTRVVASEADVPLSQINYHFGSLQGLVLSMFEHQNAELLERQNALYADPDLSLSAQWERACDYLDEDLASGYVRTLMELWAAGWSTPEIADAVRKSIDGWMDLLTHVASQAEVKFGSLGPFEAEDISALVGAAFIGTEAYLLLDFESDRVPLRRALRRIGKAIERLELERGQIS